MSMNRRTALVRFASFAAASTFLSTQAAWAGHEVDNNLGRFNGFYKGDILIREKDKEPRTVTGIKVELQQRYVEIWLTDQPVRARIDQIYTMGYKTEISAHEPEVGTRYKITVSGQIGE